MFCLEKKWKTNKYRLMFCEYTWKAVCKCLGCFEQKSLNWPKMVSIASCTACVIAPDLWQHFLTLSITLPKKQFSFAVYSFPLLTLAPFSLHSSKVFNYLSYFHSTVINSCSAVQAGSGFYCLGIQAHHEKCCWYWYEGVPCINPPS